jgi:predicted porin
MFSKKTAVAAAALLAAFAAQAQVNVYGNLDLSVGSYDEPAQGKSLTQVNSGDLRASYIGFKGQEDLGGGLKAFFKLETDIGADVGSANSGNGTDAPGFWSRTSVLGLQNDMGTLTLGNTRSLGYLTNAAFNPFADSSLFSASNLFGNVAGADLGNWANSITLSTANYSGFTAAVQVGLKEAATNVSNKVGLQAAYAAGPLTLGAVYEDLAVKGQYRWELAGAYDFSVAKLFAQYGQGKADDLSGTKTGKFFQIGASIPVSTAGTVLTSYGEYKLSNTKQTEFSLAYDHDLSKRTGAYIGLNYSKDKSASPKTGTSVAAGIRHSF